MTTFINPRALAVCDTRLEAQLQEHIAERTSALDPDRDAVMVFDDLTTDDLAIARRGIAQRKRDRNTTPRDEHEAQEEP